MAELFLAHGLGVFIFLSFSSFVLSIEVVPSDPFPSPIGNPTPIGFQNFSSNFRPFLDQAHVLPNEANHTVKLLLTEGRGAGFCSKSWFLYGRITLNLKLVPGDSSGTESTFYLTSIGPHRHDEIDFRFFGDRKFYSMQTNVIANSLGGREQRFALWFDPTLAYHAYTFMWNSKQIVFLVDGTPIRVFKNNETASDRSYLSRPLRVCSKLTESGASWVDIELSPINWSLSPFTATYQAYSFDACEWKTLTRLPPCADPDAFNWWEGALYGTLTPIQNNELRKVRESYMLYDYCADRKRYPIAPPECSDGL